MMKLARPPLGHNAVVDVLSDTIALSETALIAGHANADPTRSGLCFTCSLAHIQFQRHNMPEVATAMETRWYFASVLESIGSGDNSHAALVGERGSARRPAIEPAAS